MWWGLLLVLVGAACAGFGAVLQALAARAVPDPGTGLRPGLVLDLVRQWRFLAGIGLDVCSFLAAVVALRVMPVFVVQAATAASLAVTAIVAWRVLGTRLRASERTAVMVVCLGLAALGASAAPQSAEHGSAALHVALLASLGGLVVLGLVGARLPGRWSAATLGCLAGLAFGLVNLGSRMIPSFAPADLLAEPAAWMLPFAGLCALLFYNTALQRESVVAASAGTIVGQTTFPAIVGLVALGDHTRPGFQTLATVGFVVAVLGALLLTRFGDLSEDIPARSGVGDDTDATTLSEPDFVPTPRPAPEAIPD